MTPNDAYNICGGLAAIRACEDEEVRNGEYAVRRATIYGEIYDSIPANYRGSLLLEAVSEMESGCNLDDEIIEAYAAGNDVAMAAALRSLLDKYRATVAERETRKGIGE